MAGGNRLYAMWRCGRNPVLFCILLFLSSTLPTSIEAAIDTGHKARLGTHWTTPVIIGNDAWAFNAFLVAGGGPGPAFAFGFLKRPNDGFFLSVFLVLTSNYSIVGTTTPEVVWTANRNKPVNGFAELHLTADGDLGLSDGRGNQVWCTNTSGRGVVSLQLTEEGNLALVDARGRPVWQSYDHPTDTALRNQTLTGMTLVANASATNSSLGTYYLSITNSSYEAYIVGDNGVPAQMYYTSDSYPEKKLDGGVLLELPPDSIKGRRIAEITQINYANASGTNKTGIRNSIDPSVFAKGFVRLEADGHLREYRWMEELSLWQLEGSLLDDIGVCGYPKICGKYGLCTDGDCSCSLEDETNTAYFQAVDEKKLKQGCRPLTDRQPSCADPRQKMVLYRGISYFGYAREADMVGVGLESCKQACAMNCSCEAAFLKYGFNESNGDCYLVTDVLSVITNRPETNNYNSSAYMKVQLPDSQMHLGHLPVALTVGIVGVLTTLAGVCFGYVLYRRKSNLMGKAKKLEEADDQFFQFDHLPGMPTKFAYEDLKAATDGFSTKLGEGGFGAVFKGTLKDGTQVAVKILGYRGQGMKEFLAEVETIGSIHHLNLVRLIGYCAERLHRLLVYEYLSNGSLEKWIFHDEVSSKHRLDWDAKTKIIMQVAKALSYLHEECRHRIIHLDIKPQNILLDDYFNAKVSDFGLSKLVERDQSQVFTTMRGTPGYLAPEWLSSAITEKVDVYSFGVVLLETVSGKRILDYSRSQESFNLLSLLSKVAAEGRLADIIDTGNDNEEMTTLVKIAMWCLQMDFTKRPSMSAVVKALEGAMEVEPAPDFWIPTLGLTIPSFGGSTTMSSTHLPSSTMAGPSFNLWNPTFKY